MEFTASILTELPNFTCLPKSVIKPPNAATMSKFVVFNKPLWHMRLGHPNDQVLKYVFPNDRSAINKCTNLVQTCTHCLYGKMHNLPFPKSHFVASSPFELVHFDV